MGGPMVADCVLRPKGTVTGYSKKGLAFATGTQQNFSQEATYDANDQIEAKA